MGLGMRLENPDSIITIVAINEVVHIPLPYRAVQLRCLPLLLDGKVCDSQHISLVIEHLRERVVGVEATCTQSSCLDHSTVM